MKVREAGEGVQDLAADVTRLRVGGSYWGAQPDLPENYVLLTSASGLKAASRIAGGRTVVVWDRAGEPSRSQPDKIAGECDPWHMLSRAEALVADADDQLLIIAALLECPSFEIDIESGEPKPVSIDAGEVLREKLSRSAFENPFTGAIMQARDAVALCGFWRQLIDSNRDIFGGLGFAFWKQDQVAPLLWGGTHPFKFLRKGEHTPADLPVAVWRSKAAPAAIAELECKGCQLVEVEDGFLRSRGLGADCIPPLSITVDRLGAHFDPKQPSELESLLQRGEFDLETIERASELRALIVEAGIGKYDRATISLARPAGQRRHILVPGQVEDDRAVIAGGCGLSSNLELLKRVRDQAPDAFILYKPHPDVVAGHRRGAIPDAQCLQYADEIVADSPIAALIAMVDEVHVNTSLAGFEALLREKKVTTYGVPFYAGWGLTEDLGPVPSRRSARRSLDELVAATLLLYPRYLDPVTGLPCPAEVVVARLSAPEEQRSSLLVGMRRLQGKFMRRLRSLTK